jgi:ankyrin repeat protein
LVQLLLNHQPDITVVNKNGSNALHITTKRGHIEVVKVLISSNFPLEIPKSNGITAVGIAVHSGHSDILEVLVEAGADINTTT